MRLFYFSFFFAALLLLTACGKSEITAQAVAEQPIKIGVNFPMTGGLSIYGEPLYEGLMLGIEEVNKAGGTNGRQLQIILEDNGGKPQNAVSAAQKLIETDNVNIMLSTIVGPTGAIVPITESNKKILLYAAATDTFARKSTHVFKDSVDAKYDCEVLVAEALKRGMTRVALLGAIGEFTEDCKKSIEEGIAQAGNGELVLYESYDRGETDFRTRLTKIKASSPSVIFISAYADDCILIWKHVKELDVQVPFMIPFAQTGCGEERAMKEITGFPAKIIGLDFIVDKNSQEYKNFINGFHAKYNKDPSLPFFTMLAYDWAHYVAKAFEQCDAENSDCLRTALEKTNYSGALGKVSFEPHHATFRPRKLIMFDGTWTDRK